MRRGIAQLLTASFQGWLYDFHIDEGIHAYVHLPMVYASRVRAQLELYAAAMRRFPRLLRVSTSFQPEIIDGVVVRFPTRALVRFKIAAVDLLAQNPRNFIPLARAAWRIWSELPALCCQAETAWLSRGLDQSMFRRMWRSLVAAASISLGNPFVELAYHQARSLFGSESNFRSMLSREIYQPTYSHIMHYEARWRRLRSIEGSGITIGEEIVDFAWHEGFLAEATGDGAPEESPWHVASVLGVPLSTNLSPKPRLDLVCPHARHYEVDPVGLAYTLPNNNNALSLVLRLFRIQQAHEEFRHYWQARAVRLLRLVAQTPENIESWTRLDYERQLPAS